MNLHRRIKKWKIQSTFEKENQVSLDDTEEVSCAGTLKKWLPSGSPKSTLIELVNEPLTTIDSNEPICSHMCTEMPNLKANFPYFLD